MAGYSGTPLVRKLGIRDGSTVLTVGAHEDLETLLEQLPKGVRIGSRYRSADLVLVFAVSVSDM